MKDKKVHLRYMRFLYCSKRKDAVQTTKKICKIYKADAIALPAIEK